jgi:hypothetical protein
MFRMCVFKCVPCSSVCAFFVQVCVCVCMCLCVFKCWLAWSLLEGMKCEGILILFDVSRGKSPVGLQ